MFGYEPEYIDCGDARIACYDIGRGHPLILLHGNGEDSSYWNAQISEFTRFMRVIAVDSPVTARRTAEQRGSPLT